MLARFLPRSLLRAFANLFPQELRVLANSLLPRELCVPVFGFLCLVTTALVFRVAEFLLLQLLPLQRLRLQLFVHGIPAVLPEGVPPLLLGFGIFAVLLLLQELLPPGPVGIQPLQPRKLVAHPLLVLRHQLCLLLAKPIKVVVPLSLLLV